MTFLVDASVAAKWFVQESLSPEALSLLDRDEALQTVDLLVVEVSNIAWKKTVQAEISAEKALLIATTIQRFFHSIHPSAPFAERAVEIALALHHPVYDCFYLASAEAQDTTLITADDRLCRAVANSEFASLTSPLREFGIPPS